MRIGLALAWFAAIAVLGSVAAAAEQTQAVAPQPGGPGPHEVMAGLSLHLFAELAKEPPAARHNPEKVLPILDRLLSPNFDRDSAARLVLGLHWRGATAEQREQFAKALYQRLLRTYAGAVTDWTPDRFKLLPLLADPAAVQVTVHTLITNSRGEIVPVDFRMHEIGEYWKIYDVTVDGVSYVRNYHDDTDAEVTQKGLDAAIARLQKTDSASVEHASNARDAR